MVNFAYAPTMEEGAIQLVRSILWIVQFVLFIAFICQYSFWHLHYVCVLFLLLYTCLPKILCQFYNKPRPWRLLFFLFTRFIVTIPQLWFIELKNYFLVNLINVKYRWVRSCIYSSVDYSTKLNEAFKTGQCPLPSYLSED